MNVVVFGSYRAFEQPRVQVLLEGLRDSGDAVTECNVPLPLDNAARVRLLRQPWRATFMALRLASVWPRLWRLARGLPTPDAVVVPYLGHFDVHLARRLWPRAPLALDYLLSGADTARDRGHERGPLPRLLGTVDRAALAAADVPFVDTEEHLERLPGPARGRAVVVPVGAPAAAFRTPREPAEPDARLRVIFFGSYTPLQGAPIIGRAIAALAGGPFEFVMVGGGQDHAEARRLAGTGSRIEWVDWVDTESLTDLVASCDVCLGIFGTGPKARRVVPQKVFHGAAAGCAIVTSDTAPQRRALGEAAVYVPPGDAPALAAALAELSRDPERVRRLRAAAAALAGEAFTPEAVVRPLRERLLELVAPSAEVSA